VVSVLLLEPHADSRELYVSFLRHVGLRVVAADTTDQVMQCAHTADIVVTGIRVNGSDDGLGLIRRLRARHSATRLPIVVLTACALASDEMAAKAAGCDVFLTKPCLPGELVRTITKLTGARRPARPGMVQVGPKHGTRRKRA
jgi:CheY-like chemotaxis protein